MTGNPYRRSEGGRHRLGAAGLRHCREFVPARGTVSPGRRAHQPADRAAGQRQPAGRAVGRAVTAVAVRCVAGAAGALALGLLAVSGWYTAAGASAVAQMITP